MRRFARILSAAAAAGVLASTASATTIGGITLTGENIFRDFRGINDVGVAQGDRLQFGGQIAGGSAGAFGAGIFTPTGSPVPTIIQNFADCGPLTVNPNFCARSTSFSLAKLDGSWAFKVQKGGLTATFPLPPSNIIPRDPVPFPSSVTIKNSADGIHPTISWNLPPGFTPDSFRVQIYDRSAPPIPGGSSDIIHTTLLSPTDTSYTFPTVLSSGQTLSVGDKYTIDFQVIKARPGHPVVLGNADILTRSNSFFDFTPQLGSVAPGNIQLPQVDLAGVYHFTVDSVGPDSTTFIDPAVATGYIYDTGAGDPNFASVILPDVGDGIFDLAFLSTHVALDAGEQFFFPAGGVPHFTVTGIETSAHLDPADTLAFITGLTFVSQGSFTGTMTPITQEISTVLEPGSLFALLSALCGFGLMRRARTG